MLVSQPKLYIKVTLLQHLSINLTLIQQQKQNDVLGDFTKRLDKIGIEYIITEQLTINLDNHHSSPRSEIF